MQETHGNPSSHRVRRFLQAKQATLVFLLLWSSGLGGDIEESVVVAGTRFRRGLFDMTTVERHKKEATQLHVLRQC